MAQWLVSEELFRPATAWSSKGSRNLGIRRQDFLRPLDGSKRGRRDNRCGPPPAASSGYAARGRAVSDHCAAFDLDQHELSAGKPLQQLARTRLIEEELNGASGILNFESTSEFAGQVQQLRPISAGRKHQRGLGRGAEPPQTHRGAAAARRHSAGHPGRGRLQRRAADHHAAFDRRQSDAGSPSATMIRNILGDIPGCRSRHALFDRALAPRLARSGEAGRLWVIAADDVPRRPPHEPRKWPRQRAAEPSTSEQRTATLVQVKGQSIAGTSSDRSSCAPMPMARRCGCAVHRDWRIELPVRHAPEPQADRRPFGAVSLTGARDRQRSGGEDEGLALLPGHHRL